MLLDIVRLNQHSINELVAGQNDFKHIVMNETKRKRSDEENSLDTLPMSLLIGDSLVKDIRSKGNKLSTRSNIPRLSNVTKEIEKFNDLEKIYVVIGTNDCKSTDDPPTIAEAFKTLIQKAKKRARDVHISSIPPRADDEEIQAKISTVNQMLVVLANEENVTFINNDDNFTYRNNSIDKSLLQDDHCHLSHQGAERLISNLSLQDQAYCTLNPATSSQSAEPWVKVVNRKKKKSADAVPNRDETTAIEATDTSLLAKAPPPPKPPITPRKITFQGHHHPLSNFYPCDLQIYDKSFCNSEAAYQYRKSMEYEKWDLAEEIAHCDRAIDAKRLGDKISTDERWWKIREAVMMEIVTQKARQSPEFRNTLLASQGNSLIEDTSHDFWGRGNNNKGKNKLGKLLETLRTNLPPPTYRRSNSNSYQRHPPAPATRDPGHQMDPGCGFCGERGHNSETCGHGRPIRCRNCQGHRHKEKNCWFPTK